MKVLLMLRFGGIGVSVLALLSLVGCFSSSTSENGLRVIEENQPPTISSVFATPASARAGDVGNIQLTVIANDEDGLDSELTYVWEQLSGVPVNVQDSNSAFAYFAIPSAEGFDQSSTVILEVTVGDAFAITSRTLQITILPPLPDDIPAVDAGADQTVVSGATVELIGEASNFAGNVVNYAWAQVDNGASQVVLITPSGGDGSAVSFTAPQISAEQNLVFEFTATDNSTPPVSLSDQVEVSVLPLAAQRGPTNLYVSEVGDSGNPKILKFVESTPASMLYGLDRSFDSVYDKGLLIDIDGNAIHIGAHEDVNYGGIATICRIASRRDNETFDDDGVDRDIRGADVIGFDPDVFVPDNVPGLGRNDAQGVSLAHAAGRIIVANRSGQHIRVFGSAAEGKVGALFAVTLGAIPWDVAYDESRDILYVTATNGTIRVLDGFLTGEGNSRETRVIRISESGQPVSTNLHGIAYESVGDRLVVSDVGLVTEADGADSGFKEDGKVFVLADVSSVNGDVEPIVSLSGANTRLGDPVSVVINGRDLLVADSGDDSILIFNNIFTISGGDVAPDSRLPDIVNPSSLALEFLTPPERPAASDLIAGTQVHSLLLTVDNGSEPSVLRLNPSLGVQNVPARFRIPDEGAENTYGIMVDRAGDVYVAGEYPGTQFDPSDPPVAHIFSIGRLAYDRTAEFANPGTFNNRIDRRLDDAEGFPEPLVQSPRGIDIDQDGGLLIVAEATSDSGNSFEIVVFSTCGSGDPIASVIVEDPFGLGDAADPVALDYDPETGDLYVTMVNGKFAVFRDFNVRFQDNPVPQIVTPQRFNAVTGLAEDAADSLSGIEYIAATKSLILSGIKTEGATAEGKMFILRGADNLGSTKLVDVTIGGALTQLANPVDVAFDGANLFVVEQAGNKILRFDNILDVVDGFNLAPNAMTSTAGYGGTPRDLVIVPDYLAQNPTNIAP